MEISAKSGAAIFSM